MIRTILYETVSGQVTTGGEELVQRWQNDPQSIIWLDIGSHDADATRQLLEAQFGIHPLAVNDALRDRHPAVDLPEQLPTPTEEADPRLERVRKAIDALPDASKEALMLRLDEGLSYEGIAAVLGIPIGTVRSRLHEAVRQLRERLVAE